MNDKTKYPFPNIYAYTYIDGYVDRQTTRQMQKHCDDSYKPCILHHHLLHPKFGSMMKSKHFTEGKRKQKEG